MKTAEIAQTLLESPSLVAAPMLRAKLGPDAYSEAFRRGWLVAEHETGMVQVSPRQDRREQMRTEAMNAEKREQVVESRMLPGRNFIGETGANVVHLNTIAPPAATPPTQAPAPSAAQDKPAGVGDQVTVSEGGQTFNARIQTINPADGKLTLSFGSGQRPARNTFTPAEVRITGRAAPAAPTATVVK